MALGGGSFADVVRAGTSVSALGIAFGMIVTTPRYLSSAAVDERGRGRFARTSARGVPLAALAVTTLLLVASLSFATLGRLFTLSSVSVVLQYAVVAIALVKLAFTRRLGLRPLHAVPAIATLGVAGVLLAVPGPEEWLSLALLAILGVVVYRPLRAGPPA
jgi:amino acid transporter